MTKLNYETNWVLGNLTAMEKEAEVFLVTLKATLHEARRAMEERDKILESKNVPDLTLLTKGELRSKVVNTTDGFLRTIDIECVIPYKCDLPEGSMIEIYLRKVK